MNFIIQNDESFNRLDIELLVLEDELKKQKYIHELKREKISYWDNLSENKNMKDIVAVGSIEFVGKYLNKVHNISKMNPIEIPEEMQLNKFLNRKYAIVDADHIPREGFWFIKDVSELKNFTFLGSMEHFFYPEIFDKPKGNCDTRLHLNPSHLFEVSEPMNILSEYRVFVQRDLIKGIQFYDGNPMIMPTPDEINTISEMISRYIINKKRPLAYALDIAIVKTNTDVKRKLSIIEMCPFASLGTYGLTGSILPYMYRDGLDWYINHNTSINKFSNF